MDKAERFKIDHPKGHYKRIPEKSRNSCTSCAFDMVYTDGDYDSCKEIRAEVSLNDRVFSVDCGQLESIWKYVGESKKYKKIKLKFNPKNK